MGGLSTRTLGTLVGTCQCGGKPGNRREAARSAAELLVYIRRHPKGRSVTGQISNSSNSNSGQARAVREPAFPQLILGPKAVPKSFKTSSEICPLRPEFGASKTCTRPPLGLCGKSVPDWYRRYFYDFSVFPVFAVFVSLVLLRLLVLSVPALDGGPKASPKTAQHSFLFCACSAFS